MSVPERVGEALVQHGLFDLAALGPAQHHRLLAADDNLAPQLETLAARSAGATADQIAQALFAATLYVVGEGRLAEQVRTSADQAGIGNVLFVADPRDIDTDVQIVVGCGDSYRRSLFGRLNEASLAAGFPWLPIYATTSALFVGPLVEPGESACLRCTELRLLACTTRYRELTEYWDYLDGRPEAFLTPGVLTIPDETLVAALAVADVLGYVTGAGELRSREQLLELTHGPAAVRAHPVSAVPSCPVCASRTCAWGTDE